MTDTTGTTALRKRFVRTTFAQPVDLSERTIIVTGAGPRSLGFATARTLASWGASILVTTRSNTEVIVDALRAELPEQAGARIQGHPLDLSDRISVESFARWFTATHEDGLDVLVNNAGVHLDLLSRWKEPHMTDRFETHWRINYLGTAHLTQLLLPHLQKAGEATGNARIVNVGSHLYAKGSNEDLFGRTRPYSSWNAYGNSKLALMHLTTELQRRYAQGSKVQAYCLHPGAVFTRVADRGLEGVTWAGKLRTMMAPVEAFFLKSPEEGAQTQIHCASKPGLEGYVYFKECQPVDPGSEAQDRAVAGRLWAETQRWIAAQ
jgi:NAD(P)-dependent dehydrogenase (short-subunit alcohol dehydrogenase family)